VLAVTEEGTRTLVLPINDSDHKVVTAHQFLWSVVLVAPILLTSWQWYLLAKTGSTLPKRWFGVRVVTTWNTSQYASALLRVWLLGLATLNRLCTVALQ